MNSREWMRVLDIVGRGGDRIGSVPEDSDKEKGSEQCCHHVMENESQ